MKDDQAFWYILFSLFFVGLIALGTWILYRAHGFLPEYVELFDFLLIILATFRLTRLFVYDKILQFFRDWFSERREIIADTGDVVIERVTPPRGPRRTMSELLGCPWCAGMWFGAFVAFFYFLTPFAWFFIFILAVGGVATLVQIGANLIGWHAEYKKIETKRFEEQ